MSIEFPHVHKLPVVPYTRVSHLVLLPVLHVGEIPQGLVAPLVELAEGGAGTPLGVKLDGGHAQTHKPGKHRLLHVGVLLEGHVLDDRRQLCVCVQVCVCV